MGIVNVTPDSFTDGGRFLAPQAAAAQGARLAADGADILDVGAESTRPGAAPVPPDEERRRLLPALGGLSALGVPVSVDTRNAATMRAALAAGAAIVNDVSALTHDPASLETVAGSGCGLVLMHMRGTPATMNDAPDYDDVVAEVAGYLAARAEACLAAGIGRGRIALDPGLGFGKRRRHNLALLEGLSAVTALGYPVLVGASGKMARPGASPAERLQASLDAARLAADNGADILRVHDVAATAESFAGRG
jgi:dihydropteroate synthase